MARTRPLVEAFDVVRDVRGMGLMWAIEFGEPRRGAHTWRFLEARQPGIFAQFVIGPLFREHHILSQVAGHSINVLKGLPPLVIGEDDVDWFATALEQVIEQAQRLPRAALRFGTHAARALPHRRGGAPSRQRQGRALVGSARPPAPTPVAARRSRDRARAITPRRAAPTHRPAGRGENGVSRRVSAARCSPGAGDDRPPLPA